MEDKGFNSHPNENMDTYQDRLDPFATIDLFFEIELPSRESAEINGLSGSMEEFRDYLLFRSGPFANDGTNGVVLSQKEYGEYHEALHGYNPNLVIDESEVPNQERLDFGDRTILYSTAGCQFEVQDLVFDGEVEEYHEQTYLAKNGIYQSPAMNIDVQPDVVAVLDDWSACMAEAGYPDLEEVGQFRQIIVDAVWNPISAVPPEKGTAEFAAAKQDEIALALIHIDCDEQVGLRDTSLETSNRLIGEYLVEHEAQLFAWYDMLSDARERTSELLA